MMRFSGGFADRLARAALAGAAFAVALAAPAGAAPMHEENPPAELRILPYSGVLPPCDDPDVLAEITQRFGSRELWFWHSPLAIVQFESASETGYRNNGASYIPRRYCRASALFSDGRERRVVYNIAEDTGLLGVTRGVTWCVVGLDPNHAYSPACRAAGP